MNLEHHFNTLFETNPREFGFKGRTKKDFPDWNKKFRARLKEILGLQNMEKDLAGFSPKAERLEVVNFDSYTREYWILHTEPTVTLPFYLLRPAAPQKLLPLVITPHGHGRPYIYAGIFHTKEEEKSIKEGERDIAVQAAKEGYLAIAPTARAFGDTRSQEDKNADARDSCHTQLMHDLLVGRTPIGDRVWDISRLIDWALENQRVDHNRIAVTGNSGGGTASLFAAACDTRISVAVPSCYFCTFQGSIGAMRHCDCNYIPGILRLGEMYDVAGLIAPRPFLAIAGRDDKIFPLEHTQYAFDQLKNIYEAAGKLGNCELYIGKGGHRYYKDGAWPFIRSHFMNL